MRSQRIIIYVILIFVFCITAMIFNYGYLENIIIPDPCYYHSGVKTSALFDLFYSTPTWNGSHPAPTWLNLLLTLLIGASIGYLSGRLIVKIFKIRKIESKNT